jgi:ATP-dependent helicase/nuclease subunit A
LNKFTIEQEKAVLHNEGNILVSASAGSGKTYVMISRIIRLIIEKKARVDNILAVTFTTAAAAEMKEKLSSALIEVINETDDSSLKEQLKLLPTANISTIHSFCANLLRSYFFETGIDANFEILDENEAVYLKNKAINLVFEEKYEKSDSEFLTLVTEYLKFRKDTFLRELIINIYDSASSRNNPLLFLKESLNNFTEQDFIDILIQLSDRQKEKLLHLNEDLIKLNCDFKFFKNSLRSEYTLAILDFVQTKLNSIGFDNYYSLTILPVGNIPRLKNDEQHLCELQEQLKCIKEDLSKLLKEEKTFYDNFEYSKELALFFKSKETANRLVNLIELYIDKYSELKIKENKLDYDDLQHKALELLKSENILNSVKSRFSYIFADEYQDVNDVQEQLLNLLSENNLFMVGDLKQSIYAFRGCNPAFFAKKYESYFGGNGHAERLNDNFRSSDGVINGVNGIFNKIMTKTLAGLDYYNEAQLKKGGLYPEGCGKAVYHIINEEKKEKILLKPAIYDLMEEGCYKKTDKSDNESIVISKIIEDELGKKFFDIKTGNYREIIFSDIVILASTRNNFENISNELFENGIPVSSDRKDNILQYPEIRFLINMLELLDSRQQDLPLLACMKNIGNFTENEMAQIRLCSSQKTYRDCAREYLVKYDDEICDKLKKLFEYIDKIRLLSEFYSADELITKIIIDNKLDLFYLSQKFGQLKLARIERFLKESYSGNRKLNCKEFLIKISDMTKPLSVNLSSGENCVKLMTIHSSKGLEFPVIIVADCGKHFNFSDENNAVLIDNKYGLVTKAYDLENMLEQDTVLRKLVKLDMRLNLPQDQMRLFYVALTRAKYNLHIVSSSPTKNNFSLYSVKTALKFSEFLQNGIIETISYNSSDLLPKNSEKSVKNIIIGKPDIKVSALIKERLYKEYPFKSSIFLPVKSSVTALLQNEDSFYQTTDIFGESTSEKGTAYHAFLQFADFSGSISAGQQLEDLLNCGKLTADIYKLLDANKLDNILKMPVFKNLSNKKLYREQEFLIKIEANRIFETNSSDLMLIQGIIDLAAIDNDGIEIIDYKLSTIEKEEDIIEKYKKQLYLYKYAAEKILGKKVKNLNIINILSESVINID